MSRKKVIVKASTRFRPRCDGHPLHRQTGTLTMDRVILEHHVTSFRKKATRCFATPPYQPFSDRTQERPRPPILDHREILDQATLAAYKETTRSRSISRAPVVCLVADSRGENRLLTKGLRRSFPVVPGSSSREIFSPWTPSSSRIEGRIRAPHTMASRPRVHTGAELKTAYSKDDEIRSCLDRYVAFLDPRRQRAPADAALQKHGVVVKILTGATTW